MKLVLIIQRVVNELSFRIPAGKVVALCGHSGAGKSTIAGLVERFYDPVEGAGTLGNSINYVPLLFSFLYYIG